MPSSAWYVRLAPLSGLLFVLLFVSGAALSASYTFVPPGDELKEFYEGSRWQILPGLYLMSISSILAIAYGASVRAGLSDGPEADQILPTFAMGGAVAAAGVTLIYVGMVAGTLDRAGTDEGVSVVTAMLTSDMTAALLGIAFPGALAALMVPMCLGALRSKALPTWLAWIGLLISLGMVTPVSWTVFMLALVWIALVSVLAYRRQSSSA